MSFPQQTNNEKILLNFERECKDDIETNGVDKEKFSKPEENNHTIHNKKQQTISNDIFPTKSSILSEDIDYKFSLNNQQQNQNKRIPRKISQSSMVSLQNNNILNQHAIDGQNIKAKSTLQNSQSFDKLQVQNEKQGTYLNNYIQNQKRIQNDYNIKQEGGNSVTDCVKKKAYFLRQSPTIEQEINNQIKNAKYENNRLNKIINNDSNYFEQFESFSKTYNQSQSLNKKTQDYNHPQNNFRNNQSNNLLLKKSSSTYQNNQYENPQQTQDKLCQLQQSPSCLSQGDQNSHQNIKQRNYIQTSSNEQIQQKSNYSIQQEKENNFKDKSIKRNQRENQINEELESHHVQEYESFKISDAQVLQNEKMLLLQELSVMRKNMKQMVDNYEKQISNFKQEISKQKELFIIQELCQQKQTIIPEVNNSEVIFHTQQEVEAQRQGSCKQLHQLFQKQKNMDVFEQTLDKERREKEEIIEQNEMLQAQIKDLQISLNYCRDYVQTSENAQMKQVQELNAQVQLQLNSKDQQLQEEKRHHKMQQSIVNEEIKKLTAQHQDYIDSTEKQINNIEIFYKKQLEDFKKTYEISIQKTKCITDEFDKLMQESNQYKEILRNCQKQLKNCEVRNSQLVESNIQLNLNMKELKDDLKEKSQEHEELLKLINQQQFRLSQSDIQIKELQIEEDNYKKLQFSFDIEGKRIVELQNQLESLGQQNSDLYNELQELKTNYDQKIKESKIIKEEYEVFNNKHSKTYDLNIENEKEKVDLEQQIIQLRLQNDKLIASNQNLDQQFQKINLIYQNIKQEQENKENQIAKLMRNKEKDKSKFEEAILTLKAELEQAQASERQKQEETVKFKQKIMKIENESFYQLEEFKNQLETYYNNIIIKNQGENNIETMKEQLQNEILALKQKVCDLQSDNQLIQLENQKLLRELQDKNDEINKLFNRLKEIEILRSQYNLQISEIEIQRRSDIVNLIIANIKTITKQNILIKIKEQCQKIYDQQ